MTQKDTGFGSALAFIESEVFHGLVDEIRSGDCVAFVGAGFSADGGSPTWSELITAIVEKLAAEKVIDDAHALAAQQYVASGRFDDAASIAIDGLEPDVGDAMVRDLLSEILGSDPSTGRQRDALLNGIPFRAVLTTNFDGRPGGIHRSPDAFSDILRGVSTVSGWWDRSVWSPGDLSGRSRHAIALHGQLDPPGGPPIVLTRRAYRDLLYRTPGYQTFLRALFATSTILFLGKSFDDAYLNELRSEIVALLGNRRPDRPLAYAAVPAAKFSIAEERYLRDSEGIQLLRFGASEETPDYDGFDALLAAIHDHTNFFRVMQRALEGFHIFWLDDNPEGHWGDTDVRGIIERIESGASDLTIFRSRHLGETLTELTEHPPDLIITNWGHRADADPVAVQLLDAIHAAGIKVPVVVFASGIHQLENRAAALRAGAAAFTSDHENLFREIHTVATVLRPAKAFE